MRIIALVLGIWLLGSGTAAAFDCSGVKLPWDIVVCSDAELQRLADERLAAFEQAKARLSPAQVVQLREDQAAWVHSYSASCGIRGDRPPPVPVPASVTECFKRAGLARLAHLRAYGSPPVATTDAQAAPEAADTPEDCATALSLWRSFAEPGNPSDFRTLMAQDQLGFMYLNGKCVPKDYAEAARWYRMAAEQGDASAQANLGLIYHNGRGVPRDDAEAVGWFRKAADQGFADAQFLLGGMYFNGLAVPKDLTEAIRWFRLAAEQENHNAQALLGNMYAGRCDCGGGIPKDYVQAYMWLNLAAAGGIKDAAQLRDELEKLMTAGQTAEAQQRTAAWRPTRSEK